MNLIIVVTCSVIGIAAVLQLFWGQGIKGFLAELLDLLIVAGISSHPIGAGVFLLLKGILCVTLSWIRRHPAEESPSEEG